MFLLSQDGSKTLFQVKDWFMARRRQAQEMTFNSYNTLHHRVSVAEGVIGVQPRPVKVLKFFINLKR